MSARSAISNAQIANILSLMGQLLDIKGENFFRVRAYERAVQVLSGMTQRLADMPLEELKSINGIGSAMASHIREIADTGALKELERLKKEIPAGVLKLLEIPNMGPKRAKALWETLNIESLDDLKRAAKEGKLRALPGFGEKLEQNILKGIDFAQAAAKRLLLWDARQLMNELIQALKSSGAFINIAPAGSLRRGKETVGDLDILGTAKDPGQAIEFFTRLPYVERVLGAGETKTTVWLKSQIQCDLRVVHPDEWGAAMLYFTGSKEHNVTLRERVLKMGMTINEYGLFKLKKEKTKHEAGRKVASKTEEEIFKALGLKWIPPELRENRGEIEAAEKGKLPKLVELKDIKGDFHNHTKLTDGSNTLEEMAEAAKKMGWEWAFIGDHSQSLMVANGLTPKELRRTIEETKELNRKSKGFRIWRSMEVDILKDGSMDYEDEELKEIGVVIAAVHSNFKMPEQEMTQRIIKAAQNPHVDIIAHLSGRLINQREPYAVNTEEVLEACKKTNTALELNGQPQRHDLNDAQAKRAKEMSIPLAVTTDAHATRQFAFMELAVIIARRAWLEKKDLLNCLSAKEIAERFTLRA